MAEIRNPAATLPVPIGRPVQPARVQAAREAQRAFFNAALAGDTLAAGAAVSARAGPAAPETLKPTPDAPDPRLRPGSIIDIKV